MRFLQILLLLGLSSSPILAQDIQRPQPEISTGTAAVNTAKGENFMIVTANPYATRAGYEILKKGGSAVDAAITAQLVLGLVEPQSSGLGGGAFMLHYDAAEKRLTSYDGRETAPDLAGPFLFQAEAKPMDFFTAVVGGRSVGVPGMPALLKETHELHGKLTWMELFDAPIKLAADGFEVSPRLEKLVKEAHTRLQKLPETRAYFLPDNEPIQAGDILKNTAYENTLRDYAFYGPSRFYRGEIAARIAQTVQNIEDNPGLLTPLDFASYEIKKRDPVCGPYRVYIICSMGEPSSGGLTLLQTLALLEGFEITNDAKGWSLITQASALAFADRAAYMADPDFVSTPGVALLEPEYIERRAALINPDTPLTQARAGKPESWDGPLYEEALDPDLPGTSHISVIDKDGNIVSMTSSIEGAFGSHVMVDGFLLNNQLTDFSFAPIQDEELVANMVEGRKRPRSSMSPTIVFDKNGAPVLVIGSAGGSRIIGYVLQRIIAKIDWGIDIEDSMGMAHIVARGQGLEAENAELKDGLEALGHTIDIKNLTSGLTAIQIQGDTLIGAADPRREGSALGE